jgi:hypothetical protein
MDFNHKFELIPQQPDSSQTEFGATFAPQNQMGFGGQQPSIMSAGVKNNSLDSLVKAKTRSRRKRKKKKVVKSYKIQESILLVEKDTFCFLKSNINPKLKIYDISNHYSSAPKAISSVDASLPYSDSLQFFADTNSIAIDSAEVLISITDSTKQAVDSTENTIVTEAKIEEKTVVKKEKLIVEVPKNEGNTTDLGQRESLKGEVWLMVTLVGLLFLIAYIRLIFNNKLKNYTQALFSFQKFRKTITEQNSTSMRLGVFLSIVFYINIGLLSFYALFSFSDKTFSISGLPLSISLSIAFLLYFTCFAIVNKLIAYIFEGQAVINEYLHNLFFLNRLSGLFLVPILIIYPYISPQIGLFLLILAFAIIALSLIFRWFRGIQISFTHRVPYFYMILYLCSLEIIPLLLIYKLIIRIG